MLVLRGTDTGIVDVDAQLWHIGGPGMPGDPELFDRLGFALG